LYGFVFPKKLFMQHSFIHSLFEWFWYRDFKAEEWTVIKKTWVGSVLWQVRRMNGNKKNLGWIRIVASSLLLVGLLSGIQKVKRTSGRQVMNLCYD
jgi:hypothetical protein